MSRESAVHEQLRPPAGPTRQPCRHEDEVEQKAREGHRQVDQAMRERAGGHRGEQRNPGAVGYQPEKTIWELRAEHAAKQAEEHQQEKAILDPDAQEKKALDPRITHQAEDWLKNLNAGGWRDDIPDWKQEKAIHGLLEKLQEENPELVSAIAQGNYNKAANGGEQIQRDRTLFQAAYGATQAAGDQDERDHTADVVARLITENLKHETAYVREHTPEWAKQIGVFPRRMEGHNEEMRRTSGALEQLGRKHGDWYERIGIIDEVNKARDEGKEAATDMRRLTSGEEWMANLEQERRKGKTMTAAEHQDNRNDGTGWDEAAQEKKALDAQTEAQAAGWLKDLPPGKWEEGIPDWKRERAIHGLLEKLDEENPELVSEIAQGNYNRAGTRDEQMERDKALFQAADKASQEAGDQAERDHTAGVVARLITENIRHEAESIREKAPVWERQTDYFPSGEQHEHAVPHSADGTAFTTEQHAELVARSTQEVHRLEQVYGLGFDHNEWQERNRVLEEVTGATGRHQPDHLRRGVQGKAGTGRTGPAEKRPDRVDEGDIRKEPEGRGTRSELGRTPRSPSAW